MRWLTLMWLVVSLPVLGTRDALATAVRGHDQDERARQDTLALRIENLEKRLNDLQQRFEEAQRQAKLERLRAQAKVKAQEQQVPGREGRAVSFYSGQRQLSALNPEISATGDFGGWFRSPEFPGEGTEVTYGPGWGNRFYLREAEFHVVAPLDPYTRGKFFLGIPGDGHLHVGEAYMEWINLPTRLNLKIGKYRNQFGVLNRWHEHALPQVDRPLALTSFLGEEGLSGMGVAGNWLLPKLWAHANELNLEFISGGGGVFAEEGRGGRVVVTHLKNYWDVTNNSYLELGFSSARGYSDPDAKHAVWLGGIDLTYKWVPAGRSKYRTFELRSEWIGSRCHTARGWVKSWGSYIYVQNKLNARWWAGFRLDYTHLPEGTEETLRSGSLVLTFWQSEFVFFRLQVQRTSSTFSDDISRVILQAVWSMGPHKHEAY